MRVLRGFVVLLIVALCGPAHAASEKLVYKIDSVIASIQNHRLHIQAAGAVRGGGWKAAKLRLVRSDPHAIVVHFVATPPPPNAMVIQGLMPVRANIVVRMRKGVVAVRAISDANEMTTQILK